MAKEPKKIQIIDDTAVRELYANKLVSASFDGGAVAITLGVTRFVPEDSTQAPAEGIRLPVHVTARLAVSPSRGS